MSHDTDQHFKSEISAWTVIGLIFGAVNVALWAPVLWQTFNG